MHCVAVHMRKSYLLGIELKTLDISKTFKRDVNIYPKNVFVLYSTCLYVYVCIYIYKHTTKIYTLSQRQNKNYKLLSISEICIHFWIAVLSMLYVIFHNFPNKYLVFSQISFENQRNHSNYVVLWLQLKKLEDTEHCWAKNSAWYAIKKSKTAMGYI